MNRLQEYLKHAEPKMVDEIRRARHAILHGDPTPFSNMLQSYYQRRPFHAALYTNESALQVAIETLWFDQRACISELSLVIDPSKVIGRGRDGRLDIFLISSTHPASAAIELKNFTLSGLWEANGSTRAPPWEELKQLREVLATETEEQLLQRRYSYFDKTTQSTRITSLLAVKDEAVRKAEKYLRAIKGGMANNSDVRVHDRRVRCVDGESDLYGYVLMCIGNARILTWTVCSEKVDHVFEAVQPLSL
jgi:hypothetical protein